MALFAYPIDRPVEIWWFTPLVLFLGVIYVIAITLVNVVAVGYDTITYTSLDYNGTHNLWYDRLVPTRGPTYNHRSCDMAILKLNDCMNSHFNANVRHFYKQHVQLFPLPVGQLQRP